jgi:hypothetical protein
MNSAHEILGLSISPLSASTAELHDHRNRPLMTGSPDECAQERLRILIKQYGLGLPNLRSQTIAGRQYWSDVFAHAGWRIQRNTFTQHHRLLDPRSRRWAWGSWEACRTAMEQQRLERGLTWKGKRLVLLIHGILRSQGSMKKLGKQLERADRDSFSVTYPSTRLSIHEAACDVAKLLQGLQGIKQVDIVTHSMGALVTRTALDLLPANHSAPAINRLAFLGPPSQGSKLAEGMHDWWLYHMVTGPAGQNLRPCEAQSIPPPTHPTLVVAGNTGFGLGRLRGIDADSDGTVTVEEANLPGAKIVILPVGHTTIMNQSSVQDSVAEWLDA